MHIVAKGLNIIDDGNLKQIATLERKCEESITLNKSSTTDTCGSIIDYIE